MAFTLVFLTKKYFDFQIAVVQFVEQVEKKKNCTGQLNTKFHFLYYDLLSESNCMWLGNTIMLADSK